MNYKSIKKVFGKNGFWYFCYFLSKLTKLDRFMPDEAYLRLRYRAYMGKKLNINPPTTYNEKLQWLKLHDHNPMYTTMVDKFAAKSYVANIIGEKYIIPTLGVWDKVEAIEFDKLPNQFVLKCTHDSGGIVICKDKSMLDIEKAKNTLRKCLAHDQFSYCREFPYKEVPRRIIAEKYMMDDETQELRDYKFFCFDGVVKALFIATGRQLRKEPYFDFFDTEFKHIDMRHGHPNAPQIPTKPKCFEEMKELAAKLSANIPHVRVDFYEVNGHVYFGELTFYHHAGTVPFDPPIWDKTFGDWLKLPNV